MSYKPNNKFKAVFNPYSRELFVKYGTGELRHQFESECEWTSLSLNGDDNQPHYLHIQLDYDEELQLIFYARVDHPTNTEISERFNEGYTKSWCSARKRNSRSIKIVNGDEQFEEEVSKITHF